MASAHSPQTQHWDSYNLDARSRTKSLSVPFCILKINLKTLEINLADTLAAYSLRCGNAAFSKLAMNSCT